METCSDALLRAEQLLSRRELASAIEAFKRVEPGEDFGRCSAGRWLAHMLTGDFETAWRESDAIRRSGVPDPHRFWNGEPLEGKRVILRCLHGLGDAVQFLRFASLLQERTAQFILEVPPPLLQLAPCFEGVSEVITWGEQAPEQTPEWDVQIEINELPYIFRTNLNQLPLATNYLHVPPSALERTKPVSKHANTRKVGLVWASGEWNTFRSVPFELITSVLQTPGCEFWNLQGGRARQEWSGLYDRSNLHDAEICSSSVMNLAALVAQLDLVIASDTLAVHLAGALGVPAWVMLEHQGDWRWMHGRSDSPWYPSLRLFRQDRDGNWPSVVRDVQDALSRYASAAEQQIFSNR